MVIVAVAGGLGDMGRLITDALRKTGKHEVYALTRQLPDNVEPQISPLTGEKYFPIIKVDYTSEQNMERILSDYKIHTIICTLTMSFEDSSEAQVRLIRAADRAASVKRFIPSEFHTDYDLDDDTLPYPDKRFHRTARRELEKTSLEYTYIYTGLFMDYFGMPYVSSHLRRLCLIIDPEYGMAHVPGDGQASVPFSYTTDVARYTALALDLHKWPRSLTTFSSRLTPLELVEMTERVLGRKLEVQYQPAEKLLRQEVEILPTDIKLSRDFPGGLEMITKLVTNIGACIVLGAYDSLGLEPDSLNLVAEFKGRTEPLMTIEKLMDMVWIDR